MDRNYQRYNFILRMIVLLFILLLMLSSLLSCSKQEEEQEIYMVRMDDIIVNEAEVMVYAYQVYEEFMNVGGENVWEFEDFSGGKSAIEVAGDAVLKNIVRIKTIQKKADEFRIELSDEQKNASIIQADNYYQHLPDTFRQEHGITKEIVHKVFAEFARANNVYRDLTSDLSPDEEAIRQIMLEDSEYEQLMEIEPKALLTQIQFQRIFISSNDGASSQDLSAEERMQFVRQEAMDGVEFDALIDEFNQGEEIGITYVEAFIPEDFKEQLTMLEAGEISQVIVNGAGAYLFKVVEIIEPSAEELASYRDNFSKYEMDLRQEAIDQLKSQHFDVLYEEWRRNSSVEIDREQWEKVDFNFE